MEKKSAKKYIGLLCCLVFVIAAITMSVHVRGFSAGAGKGERREVSDLETLSVLLEQASSLEESHNMTLKASFSHYKVEGMIGAATSVQYNTTAYLTEAQTLLEIDTVYSSAQGSFYAVMQLYYTQDQSFVRFERVFGTGPKYSLNFPEALLYRWLDLSEVNLSEILDLISFSTEKHANMLGTVARVLTQYKTDGFSQKGQKFTMTSSAFSRLGAQIFSGEGVELEGEEEYSGSFQVNLSDRKCPKLSFALDADQTIVAEGSSLVSSRVHVINEVEYTLSNIGNTAIQMPKNLKTVGAEEYRAFTEGRK